MKLGRVALDGTKLRASANKHKAMSYDRLGPKIEQLEAEVAAILAEAEATDVREDEDFGEDRRGDELPAELARRETRLAKLRAAKKTIEADAADKARKKAAEKAAKDGRDEDEIAKVAEVAAEKARPEKTAQRNFTDPEARMMKTNDGFQYAYNAQAVVDEESQVIIAAEITQQAGDVGQLIPMIAAARESIEAAGIETSLKVILADAGYCSEDNLARLEKADINALIATGRLKRGEKVLPSPRGRIPRRPRDENAWHGAFERSRRRPTTRDERPSSNRPSDR